jgi:hypothetical protein
VQPEDPFAERVLEAGAAGFLSKESAPEELVSALQKVLAGRRYVSPSTAERLAQARHEEDADRPLHESLTDRELHGLRLLVSGMTVTEVARELGRSADPPPAGERPVSALQVLEDRPAAPDDDSRGPARHGSVLDPDVRGRDRGATPAPGPLYSSSLGSRGLDDPRGS